MHKHVFKSVSSKTCLDFKTTRQYGVSATCLRNTVLQHPLIEPARIIDMGASLRGALFLSNRKLLPGTMFQSAVAKKLMFTMGELQKLPSAKPLFSKGGAAQATESGKYRPQARSKK